MNTKKLKNPASISQSRLAEQLDELTLKKPRSALFAMIEEERKRHKSILGVHEIRRDSSILNIRDRLDSLGYEDYEPVSHTFVSERAPVSSSETDGGEVVLVQRKSESVRSLVFLRRCPDEPEGAADAVNLSIFLHEVGHVDDFEKGKNIVIGQPVNEMLAELHAHRYACKRLMKLNCRIVMSLYIETIVERARQSLDIEAQAAARHFIKSGEFKNICQYLMPVYEFRKIEPPNPDEFK